MAGRSRVISTSRSVKLKAKWDDPAKGADGLTYRERQAKRQRERMIALNAAARASAGSGEAVQRPQGSTPAPAAPPTNGETVVVSGQSNDLPSNVTVQSSQAPAPEVPSVTTPAPTTRIGRLFR